MSVGFSGKALVQKLGIRPGDVFAFVDAPTGYDRILGKLPEGARLGDPSSKLNFVQVFAKERKALEESLPYLEKRLDQNGMIWISWPKRTSKIITDLTDRVVREIGLRHGLVDVKECAMDDSWSGLKFVRRVKNRRLPTTRTSP